MRDTLNVLLVSGGGFQGLTLTRLLRCLPSVRILVADCFAENIGKYFADSYFQIPPIFQEDLFLAALLDICKREDIRIVFPSTEFELLPLALARSSFATQGVLLALPPADLVNTLQDKQNVSQLFRELGLPTLPVSDPFASRVSFPIIGKPRKGFGGKGLQVVRNRVSLDALVGKEKYHWEPYLESFQEYSIDFSINFSFHPSPVILRSRLRTSGGFALISAEVHNFQIETYVSKLVGYFGASQAPGIYNVQILRDDSGLYFSDLNLRVGTSAVFSAAKGENPATFICREFLNQDSSPFPMRRVTLQGEYTMVRFLDELWVKSYDAKRCRSIIFDLDETLLDQKRWIFAKLQLLWPLFAEDLGAKENFLYQAMAALEEGNRGNLIDCLIERLNLKASLRLALIHAFREAIPSAAPVYPDVVPSLRTLKASGRKLSILSDNPPASQRQKLKVWNQDELFDTVVFTREHGEEKPSATAFEVIAAQVGVPLSETIVVGDNLYRDVIGGLGAGVDAAFWLQREGAFFNFDEGLFQTVSPEAHYFRIKSLRDLLWYFSASTYTNF